MLNGYDKFCAAFSEFKDSFVVIGGTAVEMLRGPNPRFMRTTKDIDMVVMTPEVNPAFSARLMQFIRDGKYEPYQGHERPFFYRYMRPKTEGYPWQIEMLTKSPLPENAEIKYTRISESPDESLSAMIMDEAYYDFVQSVAVEQNGVRRLSALGLVVFKAHAYLNLMDEYSRTGNGIVRSNALKHRRDVFMLTNEILATESISLPAGIAARMQEFIASFPATSREWERLAS